eukprot:10752795-Lingulodinium_polyedra.AAC.1
MELSAGDLVDSCRPPASKAVPGWKCPATVTDVTNIARSTVSVRWQSHAFECPAQGIRRAL